MQNKLTTALQNKKNLVFLGIVIFLFITIIIIATQFKALISSNYFKLNSNYADKNIVIVTLDSKTINSEKFKRFQDINRCDYAQLIRNIIYGGPKVIGLDVFFYQKSSLETCDNELVEVLNKNKNVISGVEYDEEKSEILTPFFYSGAKDTKTIATNNVRSFNDLNFFGLDKKDIKNKVPIYYGGKNLIIPLSFELYKRFYDFKNVEVTKNYVIFDNSKFIPINNGLVNINYFTKDYKEVSFIDVLENNVDNEIFKDKVVFVGATASDIHDEFLTTFDSANFMPGVVIHANMYNTLSSNKYLIYENIISFFILNFLLFVIFILVLINTNNILKGILYSFGVLISFIITTIILFYFFGIFIEIFPAIISYIIINLIIYLKKYFEEKKSKDDIKGMFSKYISEDVANELIKLGIDSLKLGGHERIISVFFSDLAGFTDLSEKLKPDDLGKILNIYFEEMSSLILNDKGTIDKFIGDAIMAFWNAPLDNKYHADCACRVALLQRQALEKVRIEVKNMGVESKIDMRIGINTGPAVVGNFGCSKRYDYTALGDTVNLASRLESINKQYGTNVIISENTYTALVDNTQFITRELDMITVKGKIEPIKIYELIGFNILAEAEKIDLYKDALRFYKEGAFAKAINKFKEIGDEPSKNFIKRLEEIEKIQFYSEALKLYRDKKFEEAKIIFSKIGDAPSMKFIERCDDFITNPPEKNWDGVYRFKIK